jgi:hypothetical protein
MDDDDLIAFPTFVAFRVSMASKPNWWHLSVSKRLPGRNCEKLTPCDNVDGVLAFAVVSLASTVPSFDDKWRQRVGVYIWTCCFIVIFSCLMALFKIKNEAYPFKMMF